MAKGDKTKVQNAIDTSKGNSNNNLENLRQDTLIPQQQALQNRATVAADQATQDYGNIMKGYQDFKAPTPTPFVPISAAQTTYTRSPELNTAISGYKDFSQTGGFTPEGIADIRARGVSPIRAAYANAQQNINRQRSLAGGYAPNYIAATEKMSRTMPGQIAEANQNINANLAQMIQQGRLAGLSGLGNLTLADTEMMNRMLEANAGRQMEAGKANMAGQSDYDTRLMNSSGMNLNALNAMSSLYGTTPAQAALFGNQALQATGQRLQGEGLQGDVNQALVNQQLNASQIPSNFETGLGRVGQIAKIGSGLLAPFMTGGASGLLPSSGVPGLDFRTAPQDVFRSY